MAFGPLEWDGGCFEVGIVQIAVVAEKEEAQNGFGLDCGCGGFWLAFAYSADDSLGLGMALGCGSTGEAACSFAFGIERGTLLLLLLAIGGMVRLIKLGIKTDRKNIQLAFRKLFFEQQLIDG